MGKLTREEEYLLQQLLNKKKTTRSPKRYATPKKAKLSQEMRDNLASFMLFLIFVVLVIGLVTK